MTDSKYCIKKLKNSDLYFDYVFYTECISAEAVCLRLTSNSLEMVCFYSGSVISSYFNDGFCFISFKFYRDLIAVLCRNNTILFLKCVNLKLIFLKKFKIFFDVYKFCLLTDCAVFSTIDKAFFATLNINSLETNLLQNEHKTNRTLWHMDSIIIKDFEFIFMITKTHNSNEWMIEIRESCSRFEKIKLFSFVLSESVKKVNFLSSKNEDSLYLNFLCVRNEIIRSYKLKIDPLYEWEFDIVRPYSWCSINEEDILHSLNTNNMTHFKVFAPLTNIKINKISFYNDLLILKASDFSHFHAQLAPLEPRFKIICKVDRHFFKVINFDEYKNGFFYLNQHHQYKSFIPKIYINVLKTIDFCCKRYF